MSSTSANTGTAPAQITAPAVATKVIEGTITLSPGPIPAAFKATTTAAVPLVTATAFLTFSWQVPFQTFLPFQDN